MSGPLPAEVGTTLTFSLASVDLHTGGIPADFAEVVLSKGDRFRDDFTRVCLYLARNNITGGTDGARATVVVGTEYGNLDAMLRLQRAALAGERRISAQQFPYATTSSAAVYVNIEHGVTGGNITLNAGPLTPVVALLQGALHVNADDDAVAYVLVGDTYCSEALDDVRKKAGDRTVTPGVLWTELRSGADYEAVFEFTPALGPAAADEWNGALTAHRFLAAAGALERGDTETLALSSGERAASVTVRRLT
ncbi:hypothetical protein [Kutzneria buriramensis]|uniref:Beta-ketoacyl synthase-like protein n=1 Tax=Kutzneria buriramensis TaxID=1045776 RepID=A0A3E0H0I9_9PSEU|nr:hypothetical protein [Kutzneria buriramensis]REH36387.1 hypothetical protein BCF44_116257 [Kutzneria buriramensis]